jgi:hypothetical protein
MRIVLAAGAVALLAMPAHSQGIAGANKRHAHTQNNQEQAPKSAAISYPSEIEGTSIPLVDPWRGVRPSTDSPPVATAPH